MCFFSHANQLLRYNYTPHPNLITDEHLTGYSAFTHYLSDKNTIKWGKKFWTVYNAVIYDCLAFFCCHSVKQQEDKATIKNDGPDHITTELKQ
jgi:hypothetical protein